MEVTEISIHIKEPSRELVNFINQSNLITYPKVVNPGVDDLFPGKRTTGRIYLPTHVEHELVRQGAAGAKLWFDRYIGRIANRSYI